MCFDGSRAPRDTQPGSGVSLTPRASASRNITKCWPGSPRLNQTSRACSRRCLKLLHRRSCASPRANWLHILKTKLLNHTLSNSRSVVGRGDGVGEDIVFRCRFIAIETEASWKEKKNCQS